LWKGCDRVPSLGKKQKYHRYPAPICALAKAKDIQLDTRPNGPARAAFLFAGGVRPERFGSTNASTMHHVYSGKFPYIARTTTTCRQALQSLHTERRRGRDSPRS